MSGLVSYELDDAVATIAMNDGKVNALSPAMQAELNAALDRAAAGAAGGAITAIRAGIDGLAKEFAG